jgi:hypothetical protein
MGHRITGDWRHASAGAGDDCFHVAIDDATRLAYVEMLPDETRRSTTAFLVRALRWFRTRGIRVERVMTDNGSGYVARLFRKALRLLGIRHIRTKPYTPKTNGKAERFIQTLLREWAYAIPFSSSHARTADLPRWLTWYNQQRPHGSLYRRTPVQALAGTTWSELTSCKSHDVLQSGSVGIYDRAQQGGSHADASDVAWPHCERNCSAVIIDRAVDPQGALKGLGFAAASLP